MTKARYKRKCEYCYRFIQARKLQINYGRAMCKDKTDCKKHRKVTTTAGVQPANNEKYWNKGEDEYDGFHQV